MSRELQLPTTYLLRVARSASHLYKQYTIPKRSGGSRLIDHPSTELKALQRWLLKNVITGLPVHNNATAYHTGINIADNARRHVNNRYLLRMDIENFSPSLTEEHIRTYVASNSQYFTGWSDHDVWLFCALVCKNGRLTIGAPSSPSLSNALCWKIDVELTSLSERLRTDYSRYADDLFFSTSTPNILRRCEDLARQVVENIDLPAGLRINLGKTRHASKRGRRRVTGVVLGCDGKVSLGRSLKRRVRTLIFLWDSLSPTERARLAGLLGYCKMVEPNFLNRLILKYGLERVRLAQNPTLSSTTV